MYRLKINGGHKLTTKNAEKIKTSRSDYLICLFFQLLPNRLGFAFNIGRFYIRGRIIRLDEHGQTFVIGLDIRL